MFPETLIFDTALVSDTMFYVGVVVPLTLAEG